MPREIPADRLPVRLNELHEANLRGEPTATADIFSLAFEPLCRSITKAVFGAEQDDVSDACTDAIVAYLRRPRAFDPNKSSLWTFLHIIARRRLSDARRSARRHQPSEAETAEFELLQLRPNNYQGEDNLLAHDIEAKYLSEIAKDEKELRVLELMCSEVRDTSEYAAALGLDISNPTTVREVKRVKDKLKARLRKVRNVLDTAV